jgi:hypothetical protein
MQTPLEYVEGFRYYMQEILGRNDHGMAGMIADTIPGDIEAGRAPEGLAPQLEELKRALRVISTNEGSSQEKKRDLMNAYNALLEKACVCPPKLTMDDVHPPNNTAVLGGRRTKRSKKSKAKAKRSSKSRCSSRR